ncbi:MAG TPA: hypothetical protein VMT94_03365 [Burkholderiales bacterium]|nr:hypothetical protein [Burkholderiales bacterium]
MPRIKLAAVMLTALGALTGCGDKVPESEAAKQLGNMPKQTLDKVQNGLDAAAQKDAERRRDADDAAQ